MKKEVKEYNNKEIIFKKIRAFILTELFYVGMAIIAYFIVYLLKNYEYIALIFKNTISRDITEIIRFNIVFGSLFGIPAGILSTFEYEIPKKESARTFTRITKQVSLNK